MATSVVPALIDALVANAAPAVPAGVNVYDGFGVSDDEQVVGCLMVGCEDPNAGEFSLAADLQQSVTVLATARPRDESGEIPCVALFWDGDGDAKTARDGVYAITAAVENMIRTAPGVPYFGVTGVYRMDFGSTSSLQQSQTSDGAVAYLTFRIAFVARI